MEPTSYRIAVRGRLTEHLGSAFEGLALEPGRGQSVLVGEIRDQAHLYGVLDRVRDLGLELVSVQEDGGPGAGRGHGQPAQGRAGREFGGPEAG